LKAVGESVSMPLKYYDNNVHGSVVLMQAMKQCHVKTLVFSSSATVYGDAIEMPLKEDAPTSATNPYGQSKLMVEKVIADLCSSDPSWSITALRYFNPVGAHSSGLMGEDPQGIPNNLMPFLAQVAVGRREELQVFGNDYQTPDGTGVRDYIHVIDLAQGHISALIHGHGKAGHHIFNLGTGKGNSVLEMLNAFGKACGKDLKYKIVSRRPGDVAASWADPHKAQSVLNWKAQKSLDDMCQDTWRWQSQNPNGYP
jgi:UDP-glucose 4-epimerase